MPVGPREGRRVTQSLRSMTRRHQLICVACGPIFVVSWLLGLWVFAGFVPPPSPEDTAEETARMFAEDKNSIRFGLLLTMIGSAFVAPFLAVLTVQLKRIEGRWSPFTYTNLICSVLVLVLLILPMSVLQAAAFRERDPAEDRLIADLAWLPFVGINSTVLVQWTVIGILILSDRREQPVFPRWAGYFNFWVALLSAPAWAIYWFKDGPMAWDGVFSWWLPLTVFSVWFFVMGALLYRAVERQATDPDDPDVPLTAAEVERLIALRVDEALRR